MKNSYVDEIKDLVVKTRKAGGCKQVDMAKALGVSEALVSNFESGGRDCEWMIIAYLAELRPILWDSILEALREGVDHNG